MEISKNVRWPISSFYVFSSFFSSLVYLSRTPISLSATQTIFLTIISMSVTNYSLIITYPIEDISLVCIAKTINFLQCRNVVLFLQNITHKAPYSIGFTVTVDYILVVIMLFSQCTVNPFEYVCNIVLNLFNKQFFFLFPGSI